MTDTANAPERIWAFHAGPMVGLFIGKKEVGTNVAEYVLAAHCDELVAAARAEGAREGQAKIARLTEALTPSGDTKAAYMSEFEFIVFGMNDDGEECSHKITVPWTAIKEIMAAIKARAALQENANG